MVHRFHKHVTTCNRVNRRIEFEGLAEFLTTAPLHTTLLFYMIHQLWAKAN